MCINTPTKLLELPGDPNGIVLGIVAKQLDVMIRVATVSMQIYHGSTPNENAEFSSIVHFGAANTLRSFTETHATLLISLDTMPNVSSISGSTVRP